MGVHTWIFGVVIAALGLINADSMPRPRITHEVLQTDDQTAVIRLDSWRHDAESYRWFAKTDRKKGFVEIGRDPTVEYSADSKLKRIQFKLVVKSADGSITRTRQTVILQNKAPVAKIIPGFASTGQRYWWFLNGQDSTDDKGIVSYTWTMIQGNEPGSVLTGPDVTFRTYIEETTVFQFELKVCDAEGLCDTARTDERRVDAVAPPFIEQPAPGVLP